MRKITIRNVVFFTTIFYFFLLETRIALKFYQLGLILRWVFPPLMFLCAISRKRKNGYTVTSYVLPISIAVLLAAIPAWLTCIYPVKSIAKFASFVVVLFCQAAFWGAMDEEESYEELFKIICWVTVIYAVWNFIFIIMGIGIDTGRHRGIMEGANTLGVCSNLAFIGACYLQKVSNRMLNKVLISMILPISVISVFACGSRSGFAVCLANCVAAIFLFNRNKNLKRIIIWILPVMLLGVIGMASVLDFVVIRHFLEYGIGRSEIWQNGIEVFKEHPIFGVGYALSQYYNVVFEGAAFHNSYLSYLVDVGIWGVVLLLLAIISPMRQVLREFFSKDKFRCVPYVIMMLFDFAVIAWGESYLFSLGSTEGFMIWLLITFLITYCGKKQRGILVLPKQSISNAE